MILNALENSPLIAAVQDFNKRASHNATAYGLDGLVAGVALAVLLSSAVLWRARGKKDNIGYVVAFCLAVTAPPVIGAVVGGVYGLGKTVLS